MLGVCRRLGVGGRIRLRRSGCRELLVRRQLPALGRDDEAKLYGDVGEELDRDRVATDPLDRLESDLAAVHAGLLLLPEAGQRAAPPPRARRGAPPPPGRPRSPTPPLRAGGAPPRPRAPPRPPPSPRPPPRP